MLVQLAQERENRMDKIKKYAMYFVLVIVFFIFSDFLIYVGLNSSYRDIKRQDSLEEVSIYQAEATTVPSMNFCRATKASCSHTSCSW